MFLFESASLSSGSVLTLTPSKESRSTLTCAGPETSWVLQTLTYSPGARAAHSVLWGTSGARAHMADTLDARVTHSVWDTPGTRAAHSVSDTLDVH